jgi:ADP-heptose:LPS heptosyltransferase
MPKVLIIRFSSIGDVVLTSPIVRCIKQQIKDVEVHYITKIQHEQIVENNPYIDKVYTIEKEELHMALREMKKENYDYVIDLHNNLRSGRLKRALRAKSFSFPKLNRKKFLLTAFKINSLPKDVHVVDRYFETVKKIGVKNDLEGLDYFIPAEDVIDISKFGIKKDFVVFSIGAKFATKRMPVEMIIEIIKQIESQVVLMGGLVDVERAEEIQKVCPQVINLCGILKLNKTASVLKQTQKVVCFDTGLMHIASAFKKPIVSIWGNTVTDLGMYPYMPSHQDRFSVHEVEDLSCRPCSKIGYKKCPKGHFKCMRNQDIGAIVSDINKGLSSVPEES